MRPGATALCKTTYLGALADGSGGKKGSGAREKGAQREQGGHASGGCGGGWDEVGCTALTAVLWVQAVPHSPARPGVASHRGRPATMTLTTRSRQVTAASGGPVGAVVRGHGHFLRLARALVHARTCACACNCNCNCNCPGGSRRHRPHPARIGSDHGSSQISSEQGRTHWPAVPSGFCRWPGPVALHLQAGRRAGRQAEATLSQRIGCPEAVCVAVLEVVF